MTSVRGTIGLVGFALCMALYVYSPQLFALDETGMMIRAAGTQVGGPLVAAIACLLATWWSRTSGDRVSWLLFAAAMLLYFGGNLSYLAAALDGIDLGFPSVAELAFLVMAPVFASGVFIYGRIHRRVSRTSLLNFVLAYCAITVATVFALEEAVQTTDLLPVGTVVAVVYPALWFSVAVACAISLLLFNLGGRTLAFALLSGAAITEAVADALYAGAILDQTYVRGGLTELLWVISVGLVVWAAIEQIVSSRRPSRWTLAPRAFRRGMQAAIPAAAIAVALGSEVFHHGERHVEFLASTLAIVAAFAIVAGLREYWIGSEQRHLRQTVERSRNALSQSERELDSVLQATTDSILVIDRDWRVVFLNRHAEEMLRFLPNLEIGGKLHDAVPELDTMLSGKMYRKAMATGEPVAFEEYFKDIWFDVHAYPTAGGGVSIFFRDVTAARRDRDEIVHLAHHDSLTGLANRSLFHQRLVEAASSGRPSAILLVDLDHFKEINDSLGHPIGDHLLSETARRLGSCLRPEDTIARLGGDEFAIIIAGVPSRELVAGIAREILTLAGAPHEVDGQQIRVGATVGIRMCTGLDGDADQILRSADIALYAAKADSRGTFRFFDASMEAGILERRTLRSMLAGAIERNELELVYQPLVDLMSHQVSGFEALLRWRHPTDGLVPPSVFIPVAEESGLIVPIGAWVLKTACAEAATWPNGISVAVNLSSQQFQDGEIAIVVEEALEASGLSSDRLELEITESVLLDNNKANMAVLHRLRGLGIRIALDDFGTGYSSLGYLQHFPFSKIKIDRSFVSGLPGNEESQAIVKMVIGLGKALNLRVTAEGVETEEQLNWVRRGCDEVQGYFISKPVPPAEVPALIDWLSAPVGRDRKRA
jgi:diguanylate cyclase (GGDEF)-like protein